MDPPFNPNYFDRDGQPLDLVGWVRLLEDIDYRRVAQDTVGPYWVSTIWLGINYNFFGHGPPLIFETLVFGPEDGGQEAPDEQTPGLAMNDYMVRTSTEQQARETHRTTVDLVTWDLEHDTIKHGELPDPIPGPADHSNSNGHSNGNGHHG